MWNEQGGGSAVRPVSRFTRVGGEELPDPLKNTRMLASSFGLGWGELNVEMRSAVDGHVDGVVANIGHLVVLNMGTSPIVINDHRRATLTVSAAGILVLPSGTPLAMRHQGSCTWMTAHLSTQYLSRALGRTVSLQLRDRIIDEKISVVLCALLAEAQRQSRGDLALVDSLGLELASRLEIYSSQGAWAPGLPGPLTPRILRRVREKVDAHLAEKIYVADLANEVGISPSHFTREFKRATAETPHRFIIRRRVEVARQALTRGGTIAEAAAASGFADQAHLTRWFKLIVGATPSEFVCQTRRFRRRA
jgi:AraC family transcriptional regulator